MNALPNIHPVDELAAVREEIRLLQDREAVLRSAIMGGSLEDMDGKQNRAFVAVSKRETLDKEALIAAWGRPALEPYMKRSEVKSLKTVPKEKP